TATGQEVFHHDFGPFPERFGYIPAGNFAALQAAADAETCAVLLELVQGEGGVVALDKDYVARVAAFCKERDILLLVDEVQTGVGRTGTFLACEQYDLHPDIVTLAKGLGGGLPIGAVVMTKKVADHMGPGSHGSTFGGNPVVCAGALAVMEQLTPELLAHARKMAETLRTGLQTLPHVAAVSGLGLMVGIAFEDGISAAAVRTACELQGLLVLTAKSRLRLLPPLILTQEDVDKALAILRTVLEKV
ncbi:aminotransferase class III-fold pyridoxal phosphate-dependent enzyme, partial [uncultured Subdoligranulum sp.]|uniref:aminotransferase class III-fold pyridoxal phosphate-dependent enzyme n=1 Tax=uncultured Subdoligranulum sp. TaxID=512298 RepID=UPI0025F9CBEA